MNNKNAFLIVSNIFSACSLVSDDTASKLACIFLSAIWIAVYIIESIKENRNQ